MKIYFQLVVKIFSLSILKPPPAECSSRHLQAKVRHLAKHLFCITQNIERCKSAVILQNKIGEKHVIFDLFIGNVWHELRWVLFVNWPFFSRAGGGGDAYHKILICLTL